MDENSTPDDSIFINQTDGLTNDQPPLLPDSDNENDSDGVNGDDANDEDATNHNQNYQQHGLNEDDTFEDVPKSLIVTNIDADVFTSDEERAEMEELFRFFSPAATFQWLKSFRRLRVTFDSGAAAANARIQLHHYVIGRSNITCYFAQPVTPVAHKFLKPPAPFKQFLISPPASPPAGWEPRAEGEPLVNHDLLAALANLTPGESHQLHHPLEAGHPAIVVHTALGGAGGGEPVDTGEIHEDEDLELCGFESQKARIPQTKCPERGAGAKAVALAAP